MRLPKHKLPKNKSTHGYKPAQRTAKHKAAKKEPKINEKPESEDVMEGDENEEEGEEEEQKDGEQVMETTEGGSKNISQPKSKEEKQQIRQQRLQSNSTRNEYKKRNANFSSKNGPRAINRGSN
jgi:hypothetical protein